MRDPLINILSAHSRVEASGGAGTDFMENNSTLSISASNHWIDAKRLPYARCNHSRLLWQEAIACQGHAPVWQSGGGGQSIFEVDFQILSPISCWLRYFLDGPFDCSFVLTGPSNPRNVTSGSLPATLESYAAGVYRIEFNVTADTVNAGDPNGHFGFGFGRDGFIWHGVWPNVP